MNPILALAPGQRVSDWLFFSVSGFGFLVLTLAVAFTHRPISFSLAFLVALACNYVNYRILWGLANWGGSDDTYYGFPERVLRLGWWIIAGLVAFKFFLVSFLICRRRRLAGLALPDAQQASKYDY